MLSPSKYGVWGLYAIPFDEAQDGSAPCIFYYFFLNEII
jgi:hypothetical protein